MATLDDTLIEYIRNSFIPYKSAMLISITENIEEINTIPNIDVHYDIPYVNSFMLDLITEDSLEVDPSDKIVAIEHNFKKTFIAYLEAFGIILDVDKVDEIGLNFYNECVIALKNIYSLNKEELENILRELDNLTDNNNIVMSNLISSYCNLSTLDVISVLENISDESLDDLKETIEKILVVEDMDEEEDIPEDVQELLMDPEKSKYYYSCGIVRRYITEDYRPDNFIDEMSYLYECLNELTLEQLMEYGYYNIIFLLFITTNKEDYMETLEASLEFEHIKLIDNDQTLRDKFMKLLYSTLNIRSNL